MRLRDRLGCRSCAVMAVAAGMAFLAATAGDAQAQRALDTGSMSLAPTLAPGTKITKRNRPPEVQLCNAYARQFDQAIKTAPKSRNTDRAKVLRAEARTLCREGRRGEGQLKLEAALRGIGETPQPSVLIDRRIEQRAERINEIRAQHGLAPK